MDLSWLVLLIFGAAASVATFLWFRKRNAERAREKLRETHAALLRIDGAVQSYVKSGDYMPEGVRRPLDADLAKVAERDLPPVARVARRPGEGAIRQELDGVRRRVTDLRTVLAEHNSEYVRRMVTAHARLLVEELKTDEAQRQAIVRDDHRNLVIAGAGSGKTRTIVARVRYLLERHVPATPILAVTFTNKATEEMQDRLKQMGVPLADRENDGVTVSTLHALGKRVVQSTLSGPTSVADDRWTDSLVAEVLRDARTASGTHLAQLYLGAILHFHRNEDERAPAVAVDRTYRTLRGEHVRSIGERIIADFLFAHQVAYKYEAEAAWAQVGAGRDAYHPDFKLLKTEHSIEYWGINRAGEVAAGMATTSVEYRQGMAWKREQFQREGKTLLEFYEYERTEGTLDAQLRERLTQAGVLLRPMTFAETEHAFGDMKYVGSAIERLLVQFIVNARTLRRTPDEIRRHLEGVAPRVYYFGLLGIAVLERYEARLAAEGRIDFSDMLHRAADTLERGTNPLPRFAHVLVDEFQDVSAPMARFLKALLAIHGARLFAVGDDWQAIYGFAGGDVDHILHFEAHFGAASTTMLTVNYRSPAVIVEAGAALIARNANQVPKQVFVFSGERGEAYVHEVPDDDAAIVSHTTRLVREELRQCPPDEILVLSRTNHLLQNLAAECQRSGVPVANPDRNVPGVRIMSAHKAKGIEAKVVIIVNASDHLFGFPSRVENPDVLRPVRTSSGDDQAEERRLFYVAITRTIKRLHLLARVGHPSPYFAEIEGNVAPPRVTDPSRVPVGNRLAGAFRVERLYPLSARQVGAHIRQSGLLATTNARFAFTSWAPIDLTPGATYWLSGVVKERPFRDQQRVKLDQSTRVEMRVPARTEARKDDKRELRPRPPPSHQPQLVKRSP